MYQSFWNKYQCIMATLMATEDAVQWFPFDDRCWIHMARWMRTGTIQNGNGQTFVHVLLSGEI